METNLMLPFANGTDIVSPSKKATKISKESKELDFMDNFLNVLITNMNPGDLSLDSQTSDKLTKLVNSEIESNEYLSGIDLKQFINSLKSELANEKPHKLTLDSIKATITKLISKFTDLKLNLNSTESGLDIIKENFDNNQDLTNKLDNKDNAKVAYKIHKNLEADNSNLANDSEKLLFNLRKYLTIDEYNTIKKNIQSGANTQESKLTPKVEAISRFLTEMAGKETDAKSKIVAKASDILLSKEVVKTTQSQETTLLKSDSVVTKISDDISQNLSMNNADNESKKNSLKSELNSSIEGKVVEPKLKNITANLDNKQTTPTSKIVDEKYVANTENQIKSEQGLGDNTKKESGEFGKEFTREQNKEVIKQRIVKSDISELLTRTNTKKIEATKAETTNRSNFVENAIKTIKMTKSGGSNVARIMLNPRSLGDLTMRISLVGNNVKLFIKADKSEAAEHIDRQLPLLKERLVENGLKVEQVIIESSESDHLANNSNNQNRNEQEELRRQFVQSFKNLAAKEDFDIAYGDAVYSNSSSAMSYTQAGSRINV
ncbi:MAG: flagellar hook-length control protein FliK [Ignavibacteriae bacterium]|nr:flagellar hook-length control protein FliK [Ignavibacteriota bacterium]MCB9221872.1 flagellar hook-length control protein FliK [Ignavibacteria bacterium]